MTCYREALRRSTYSKLSYTQLDWYILSLLAQLDHQVCFVGSIQLKRKAHDFSDDSSADAALVPDCAAYLLLFLAPKEQFVPKATLRGSVTACAWSMLE